MDAYIATITFLLFMSLSLPNTAAEMMIAPGESLSARSNKTWLSHSGRFAFGFYPQGNNHFVVGIWLVDKMSNKILVWTANRDGGPPVTSNAVLRFNMSGTIILADQQGKEKLIVNALASASSASMNDSGNFVLYGDNDDSNIVWQSFDHPTDTLLESQSLPLTRQLTSSLSETDSSTGRFCLHMKKNGNLVLYPEYIAEKSWSAYWTSNTTSSNNVKYNLYLNRGSLQILNSSNDSSPFATLFDAENDQQKTGGDQIIYRATLDFDGGFRLRAHDVNNGSDKIIKSWPREHPCEVNAFCSFNSYCTLHDDKPLCNCLTGYKFIDSNKKTLGCERNYSKAECRSGKDGVAFYDMVPMNNIVWTEHPYFETEDMSSGQNCSFACLVDCNCWAALYNGSRCTKHGFPLRYVRRAYESEASSTAFIKVGKNSLENWKQNDTIFSPYIIVVTSIFSALLCSAIIISGHYIYKIQILRYKRLTDTGSMGLNEEVALRRFSYNELKRATNHFKEELGKGSFGSVYKGALNKGKELIAVKRLEKLVEDGEREFQAEVRSIGKTHHRNLVRLLGFCVEGSKRLLVYEYMSNSSLGNLLFGDQRRPDWNERIRIALDIARGILYLHEECDAPIIHCDLKPQNILMDEFWTAKISDFGLAKLLMPDQTRTFTVIRGTRGYMAPEWNKNVPISVKTDVYSYGIVLLEILCCRRNLDVNVLEPEEILLSGWAYKCFVAGEVKKLVPWEVIDKNVMENMVKVALWCIQEDPFLRPTMKGVMLMLEGITDIAIPPCPDSSSA